MIKTEMQIERDFFDMLQASALGEAIRGEIYRADMRPSDAKTEDIVVKFLAGVDEQVQSGIVILNVYVPDIARRGSARRVADFVRIAVLQQHISDFIHANPGGYEYDLEADATPRTYAIEEIEQHMITARIKFKRITI